MSDLQIALGLLTVVAIGVYVVARWQSKKKQK